MHVGGQNKITPKEERAVVRLAKKKGSKSLTGAVRTFVILGLPQLRITVLGENRRFSETEKTTVFVRNRRIV